MADAIKGIFNGLTLAQLQTLQTQWFACLGAIAANQSYSVDGLQYTRASLNEVKDTIREINASIDLLLGNTTKTVRAVFGHTRRWPL